MASCISVTGVSKSFERPLTPSFLLQDHLLHRSQHARRLQIEALRDVSLHVSAGEWVGLYGHNGSGKTTLLRLIAGLMLPDSGRISVNGTVSCFLELGIGFHPERDAYENIYLHGLLQGFSRKDIAKMTDRIIAFAGIEPPFLHLPIKCYSTGMKLRLAFAAAAQATRDIYLFDEVLAVGDSAFQDQCDSYLQQMKRQGKTMLIVSHDEKALERYCDRILSVDHGRIVGERSPALMHPQIVTA